MTTFTHYQPNQDKDFVRPWWVIETHGAEVKTIEVLNFEVSLPDQLESLLEDKDVNQIILKGFNGTLTRMILFNNGSPNDHFLLDEHKKKGRSFTEEDRKAFDRLLPVGYME